MIGRPQSRVAGIRLKRAIALAAAVIISVTIVVLWDQFASLKAYGYPGVFLISLFSSATVILPVPGLALAFAAGATLNPLLVGLAVGSGAALGELTGYLAGYGGRGIVENQGVYARIQGWMERYGILVIVFLSLVPNPAFDLVGITAGIMKIPVWQFLLAAWTGNVIKAVLVASAGAQAVKFLGPLIEQWLSR